jgi:hypothetical protein
MAPSCKVPQRTKHLDGADSGCACDRNPFSTLTCKQERTVPVGLRGIDLLALYLCCTYFSRNSVCRSRVCRSNSETNGAPRTALHRLHLSRDLAHRCRLGLRSTSLNPRKPLCLRLTLGIVTSSNWSHEVRLMTVLVTDRRGRKKDVPVKPSILRARFHGC